jgi:hypothetical protein
MKLTQILTGHAEATGVLRMATSPDFTRNPAAAFPARQQEDAFQAAAIPSARFDVFDVAARLTGDTTAFSVTLEGTYDDPNGTTPGWVVLATVTQATSPGIVTINRTVPYVRINVGTLTATTGGVRVSLTCRKD